MPPETQKAKGIKALAQYWPNTRMSSAIVKQVSVYPHEDVRDFPFFARPCPMVPRHGFVDSRIIRSEAEWDALCKEVAAAEPKAEIVQMPFIPCTWSGVLTPANVTFGPGHDGATGGKGARQVPAQSESRAAFIAAFQMGQAAYQAGVTETPFVEFVEYNGKIEAVQLRNGPDIPAGSAYVPKDMTVLNVVKANGEDLLEWESKMKELAAEGLPGVVVWHPGGAMSSHYAVQAIEQSKHLQFPFAVLIQDDEPQIGSTIKATDNAVQALTEGELKELVGLLAFSITNLYVTQATKDACIHLSIAALHAQALWSGERHLLVLRAAAVAYMLRFASAAILGELRHWGTGPGKHGHERKTALYEIGLTDKNTMSRSQIFELAFRQHVKHLTSRMGTAYCDFSTPGWGSSMGGKNWANCTEKTVGLYNAVAAFIDKPTNATWSDVATAWNHVVNVFHNTGHLLNKFINASHLDTMAKVPSFGLISDVVGELVVNADDIGVHKNPAHVAESLRVTLVPYVAPKKPKAPKAPKSVHAIVDQVVTMTSPETVKVPGKHIPKIPASAVARWNMVNVEAVYVQIQMDQVNKKYGMAAPFKVAKALGSVMAALPHDVTSLTGSSTKKGAGTVELVGDTYMLKVTHGGLWVPLFLKEKADQVIAGLM